MLAAVPNSFASSANEWVIEPSPVPLAERTIFDLQRPLLKVYPPGAHTLRFVFSPMTFFTGCPKTSLTLRSPASRTSGVKGTPWGRFVSHVLGLDSTLRCVGLRHNRSASGLQSNCLARSTERWVAEVLHSMSEMTHAAPTHIRKVRESAGHFGQMFWLLSKARSKCRK